MHAYSYQEQYHKRNNAELKLKLILFMIDTYTRKMTSVQKRNDSMKSRAN